ncbi:MAG: Gfo/Idh/MocA family oxidoreductase [Devosia sp.]|nr:Gfo/Idh/MocA family oxidoreductase [Devosia sp.]
MTRKLGIGIIGLGMASLPHAHALQALGDQVEVLHAFSPSADRRAAFAKAHGLPTTDTIEAIFSDPRVNAVLVLTPPNTHLNIVQMAASAGKHVLLEKPLEVNVERAEQLVAVAEAAGITLGTVLQNRFRSAALELKAIMDAGRLGQLVQVSARSRYWRPQSYYDEPGRGTLARDGGGVLLTQAIHNLDLMISLVGSPEIVTGYVATSPVHVMEGEDVAAAILHFPNGALGSVTATTCAFPGHADVIEIIGDQGTAALNGTQLQVRLHDGTNIDSSGTDSGSGWGADPMAFSSQAHRALIADFAEAVAQGRKPAVSGRDVLAVHHLIAAIINSRGRPIRL